MACDPGHKGSNWVEKKLCPIDGFKGFWQNTVAVTFAPVSSLKGLVCPLIFTYDVQNFLQRCRQYQGNSFQAGPYRLSFCICGKPLGWLGIRLKGGNFAHIENTFDYSSVVWASGEMFVG